MLEQYLEAEIKKQFEPKRFPAPKGFDHESTGGGIYTYTGKLANGKYVELYGSDDLRGENGFENNPKDDSHTAQLYPNPEKGRTWENLEDEKYFKTKRQLDKILADWSVKDTLFEKKKKNDPKEYIK